MKLLGWKTAIATTATAAAVGLGTLALATGPAHAATPAASTAHVQTVSSSQDPTPPTLTPAELAALPLTNRHLTAHEISNLAVVLNAYHDAEGGVLNINGFINSFTPTGVFVDEVGEHTYAGQSLGDLLKNTAAFIPDVHRQLNSITVDGDRIFIELDIQGTFAGPLVTPEGTIEPNNAKLNVPTADFWTLKDGKAQTFDCYVGYSVMYAQMGITLNYAAAVAG
jgi:hypothetical protein